MDFFVKKRVFTAKTDPFIVHILYTRCFNYISSIYRVSQLYIFYSQGVPILQYTSIYRVSPSLNKFQFFMKVERKGKLSYLFFKGINNIIISEGGCKWDAREELDYEIGPILLYGIGEGREDIVFISMKNVANEMGGKNKRI